MFFVFLQATDTMEDLKRKIQSQEGIPVDPQIISFRNLENVLTCPCKTVDNRILGEFEELRTVFEPEKLIMPSEDQEMVEFHVGTIPRGNFVKSEGSKLSHVTIKTLTGKTINISVKVKQSKKLVRFSFRNYVLSMNIFVGPKLKIY